MSIPQYDAIVLDIEGTTTPISFVYETLFPYAKGHLESFLRNHWHDPGVQADVERVREQSRRDAMEGSEQAITVPDEGEDSDVRRAVLENLRWQMREDRKTTGLKSLQGKIWRHGYASGTLQGEVFGDVPDALTRWKQAHVPVYIYSSGSVEAQKLLFGHSEYGDLTRFLSGYFDTEIGPKKEPSSYVAIAREIEVEPARLLFATDHLGEAEAADGAGWNVVVMERPGNPDQGSHEFPTASSFKPLLAKLRSG